MRSRTSTYTPLIPLDRRSGQPLHTQIYKSFRGSIAEGSLAAGQRVPSTRTMAGELNVSRITVLAAYEQLEAEGYVETRTGAGTFVSYALPQVARTRGWMETGRAAHIRGEKRAGSRVGTRVGARVVARRSLLTPVEEAPPWRRGMGSFAVHQPAFDEFPFSTWSRIVARHARNPKAHALHCIDAMGARRFRETICEYLRTSRGVQSEPEQIMITSGSQQALQIAAQVLLDAGSPVWMEEPGYKLARSVFAGAGCRLIPVPVDAEGMNVAEGIRRCAQASAAYVTPSHQYPLGSTMSASRRMQLLNWAQEHGGWVIEDDYDSEYRFESTPVSSLQGLDANARVIYIGTFSKVLFASLRVGYMVIPADLVDRFAAVRFAMDIFPPYLGQEVIADFMLEGHFSRHLRRMRMLYRNRREALVELLGNELGDALEIHGALAGMHLAATLRGDGDDVNIAEEAARMGLWLWPLSSNYVTGNVRQGFILGYGNSSPQTMPAAIRKLKVVLGKA